MAEIEEIYRNPIGCCRVREVPDGIMVAVLSLTILEVPDGTMVTVLEFTIPKKPYRTMVTVLNLTT